MELTLNERSYLCNALKDYLDPDTLWDLTEVMTQKQRGLLLALDRNKETNKIKEVLENIKNFQKA